MRFLQDQVFWIFLPKKVKIGHSVNGQKYEIIHESYPDNSFSYVQNIFEYSAKLYNKRSRYIRVTGFNINKCPDYHPGAGGPSWIFADEIIVK